MKKGLLALMLVTIALLGTTAYGATINISTIGDIIIGDAEDNTTIDNNFFRFTEVFSFDDVVYFTPTDYPSSAPDVKWSFWEFEDATTRATEDWITINGKTQFTGTDVFDPGAAELRAAAASGSIADFRNVHLSPGTGSGPFPTPTPGDLAPRWIDLFAAYGAADDGTSATETIIVYAVDNGNDSFSDTPIYKEEFSSSPSSWTWSDLSVLTEFPAVTSFNTVETGTGSGDWALGFESSDTVSDNVYAGGAAGFWAYGTWIAPTTPALIVPTTTAGKLYEARWSLVGDQSDPLLTCGWRGRWGTGHGVVAGAYSHVNVDGHSVHPAGINTDVNDPSVYSSYLYPPQDLQAYVRANRASEDGLSLEMDMTDQKPTAVGKILLTEIAIYEHDPPVDSTPAYTYSSTGWSAYEFDNLTPTDVDGEVGTVTTTVDGSGITINMPARTGSAEFRMSLVTSPAIKALAANKLYRVTYDVTNSGTQLPLLRVRVYTQTGDQSADLQFVPCQFTGASASKEWSLMGSTAQEFVAYFRIKDSLFNAGDNLYMAVDAYGGYAGTGNDVMNGGFTVTGITVEEVDAP